MLSVYLEGQWSPDGAHRRAFQFGDPRIRVKSWDFPDDDDCGVCPIHCVPALREADFMRRSCADHGQESARLLRVVSLRLRAWTRTLVVSWIACVGLVSSALPCWGLDGADTGLLGIGRQREIATRQLERAQSAVEVARSAAAKSKKELDQFLIAHFETMRSRAAEPLPERRRPAPRIKPPTLTNREAEQLNAQIKELKLRRDDLLQRFTDVHPEVADVEGRLGELMLRLSSLEPAAENAESLAPSELVDPGPSRQSILLKQQQMAAEQYEQHVERWQAAEEDLKTALDAEERAVARLASIQLRPALPSMTPPPPTATPSILTSEPSVTVAAPAPSRPAASTAGESRQQGSQPLALAALLIALAVAALAAVKLARSSSDVYFENVDDVAAALALPVMGVLVPIDNVSSSILFSQRPATRMTRRAMLACELLLAVIAFAIVAYGVQNPSALWHVCMHPLESLGNIARFLAD
jgi:hypothetical protein